MKKKIVTWVVTVGFLTITAVTAHANLITNGDFSLPVPNNGTGNGWTAAHNDYAGGWRSTTGNPGGVFILNDDGSTCCDPSIQQEIIGLDTSVTYRLEGDYAGGYLPSSEAPLAVDVGSTTYFMAYLGKQWTHFSIDFKPEAASITIKFRAEINGSDTDYKIDNIALNAVPLPGAIWLLGSGFAGLIGLKCKKSIKSA